MVSEGQESGSRLSGGSWIRVSPEVIVKLSEGLTGAGRFASRWLTHMLLVEGLSSSPRGPLLRLLEHPLRMAAGLPQSEKENQAEPEAVTNPGSHFHHSHHVLLLDAHC